MTTIFDELPDCIIDKIYSNIVYPQNENLLKDIKKYGTIRLLLYYLKFISIDELNYILIDLAVVYLSFQENIIPISPSPFELSTNSLKKLDYYYLLVTDCNINKKKIISSIKRLMLDVDLYYVERILSPYISNVENIIADSSIS